MLVHPLIFFILFTVFNTRQLVAGSHRLQIKAALYDQCYITCTAFVRNCLKLNRLSTNLAYRGLLQKQED